MELKDLFYKWVPVFIKLPMLFFLFFVILTANGVFVGNINDMYTGIGVYAEPYIEASNALYIGMGLGLMLAFRLKQRFSNKTLLFTGLVFILLLNAVCATTKNPTLTVFACFVLGFAKIPALVEVYLIWLFIWSKKLDSSRFYPFVYFTALSGLFIITWFTSKLAYNYNWQFAYIWILISILICILFTIIFVENHPLIRKVPLYQMDYPGLTLLGTWLILLNYFVVHGKVENWFSSKKMIAASFGVIITFLLFLIREQSVKRPLFNLNILKKQTFSIGLLLFFLLGLFVPSTFQSAFTGNILKFQAVRNAEVSLYLIPGIFVGAVMCFIWYYKNYDGRFMIFIGFLAFVTYHIIMYNGFVTGFGLQNFLLPSAIKGFAMILIYISVGLYTIKNFDLSVIMKAAGLMIIVRSFLGSAIFSGVYNYILYVEQVRHFNYLATTTDANDFIIQEQGNSSSFYRRIQQQALLTALKEISGFIVIAGIILLIILAFYFIYNTNRDYYKRRQLG